MDYTGVMAVPITFLSKYNPEQFEIIGSAFGNSWANEMRNLYSYMLEEFPSVFTTHFSFHYPYNYLQSVIKFIISLTHCCKCNTFCFSIIIINNI